MKDVVLAEVYLHSLYSSVAVKETPDGVVLIVNHNGAKFTTNIGVDDLENLGSILGKAAREWRWRLRKVLHGVKKRGTKAKGQRASSGRLVRAASRA